jgi:BirA family biotin operon repressor/biotin-[acetyl-CoA-carboxylase] ligase
MLGKDLNGKKTNSEKVGRVCIAEHQTNGRGRKGNKWVSPFGANLYFSLGIELPVGLSVLGGLSLAIGIGLTEFLNKKTNSRVKLKWPNDLLCDNKKLAGILVEASGDSTDTSFVNVGIGINWNMSSKFTEGIDQPWINLFDILPHHIDRTELLADLLMELDRTIDFFVEEGFEIFNKKWHENSAFIGKEILIKSKLGSEEKNIIGTELGIDKNGAIKVQTPQGEQSFYSGEVSLRKRE